MKTYSLNFLLFTVLLSMASCKTVPQEPKSPVTFRADVEADLKPDQVLITGGWLIEPGQRAYLIAIPVFDSTTTPPAQNEIKNVSIDVRLLGTEDTFFEGTSLAELNTDSTSTRSFVILSAEQIGQLSGQGATGVVKIIASWTSLTMSGSPTKFSSQSAAPVLDSTGNSVTPGIFVTFTPEIAEDKQSLKLAAEATWIRP